MASPGQKGDHDESNVNGVEKFEIKELKGERLKMLCV